MVQVAVTVTIVPTDQSHFCSDAGCSSGGTVTVARVLMVLLDTISIGSPAAWCPPDEACVVPVLEPEYVRIHTVCFVLQRMSAVAELLRRMAEV